MTTHTERIFDALGDPTRRALLLRLRGGPRSVGDIANGMQVTRSAVSQHLKVLKEVQLVTDQAAGNRRLYMLDTRGIEAAREWLDGFWDRTLVAFKQAAEAEAIREKDG